MADINHSTVPRTGRGRHRRMSDRLRWSAWSPSTRHLVFGLAGAGVIRIVAYLIFMQYVKPSGDEGFYWKNTVSLLSVVGLASEPTGGATLSILGEGWFMPGMTVVLLPAQLVSDWMGAGRALMGVVNFGLLAVATFRVRTVIGRGAAWVLLVGSAVIPEMVAFSFSFWGEQLASWLVLLLFLWVLEQRDSPPSVRQWIGWALVIGLIVYVRPSLIVIIPAVAGLVVLTAAYEGGFWTVVRRVSTAILPVIVIVGLMLAPWSAALSSKKGGFYLTTTSLDLGLILAFGDPAEVHPISAQGSGSRWNAWEVHIKRFARTNGLSYKEAVAAERERFLSHVTLEEYLDRAGEHLTSFLLPDETFLIRFGGLVESDQSAPAISRSIGHHMGLIDLIDRIIWWGLLAVLAIVALVPLRPNRRQMWLLIGVKVAAVCALAHPFTHTANPRHHIVLIPWILVALGAMISRPEVMRPIRWQDVVESGWGGRLLVIAQLLASLMALFVMYLLFAF